MGERNNRELILGRHVFKKNKIVVRVPIKKSTFTTGRVCFLPTNWRKLPPRWLHLFRAKTITTKQVCYVCTGCITDAAGCRGCGLWAGCEWWRSLRVTGRPPPQPTLTNEEGAETQPAREKVLTFFLRGRMAAAYYTGHTFLLLSPTGLLCLCLI